MNDDLVAKLLLVKMNLRNIVEVLGPKAPKCSGCREEVKEAIRLAKDAIKTLEGK